jgi:hypothetical protein
MTFTSRIDRCCVVINFVFQISLKYFKGNFMFLVSLIYQCRFHSKFKKAFKAFRKSLKISLIEIYCFLLEILKSLINSDFNFYFHIFQLQKELQKVFTRSKPLVATFYPLDVHD